MNSAIERLLSLRVRDVMNTDVVTIDENATMAQAAAQFERHDITGAPVVSASGECVGVLSVSDFATREKDQAVRHENPGLGFEHRVVKESGTPIRIEAIQEDLAATHMSPVVQTVRQDATILNAARLMVREHIHRLVVVDDHQRPIGIISTLDLVACMIAAVEE